MKICKKCGQEVEDSTAYCPKCGYHFLDSSAKDDYFDNDYSTQSKGDTYGHFSDSKADFDNTPVPPEYKKKMRRREILTNVIVFGILGLIGLILLILRLTR